MRTGFLVGRCRSWPGACTVLGNGGTFELTVVLPALAACGMVAGWLALAGTGSRDRPGNGALSAASGSNRDEYHGDDRADREQAA